MKKLVLIAFVASFVAGCSTVDNAATEGKNAVQTGMRTADKARGFDAQKRANDSVDDGEF